MKVEKVKQRTKTSLLSTVVGVDLAKVVFPKHARVIDVRLERE